MTDSLAPIIDAASAMDDVDEACRIVQDALGIEDGGVEDGGVASHYFSFVLIQVEWRSLPVEERAVHLRQYAALAVAIKEMH